MRIDKYLKVSRIIKRRSIAQQACQAGAITINQKKAKPGSKIAVGDTIEITLGERKRSYEVLLIAETVRKDEARDMYRQIEG